MKILFSFIAASLMAASFLSATPAISCYCKNCICTQERHCGCFSRSEGQCSYQACQCEENCQCGYSCSCGGN